MLYRDLVQFEPIESIIRLRGSATPEAAAELVRTYVISKHMADSLVGTVLPQLDLARPRDSKGVLIVGNYGTGKSHLMSVIAAVAEYPALADTLTDARVRQAAQSMAGKFKVWRIEIGSVERPLREIIFSELEEALAEWGTPFKFPAADQVNNNKDALVDAVAAFQAKYPGQGILLVVDELLDHLLSRHDQALILDLGFLRELGEVGSETPFRFIGGVQELLFDSPRFNHVQAALRRVRDRFEQVLIAREDIAYVVSRRLLNKTDAQLARVTEHLRRFEPLYSGLAEHMDAFATLFPFHPAYLDVFQDLFIAEKRQVLNTFSAVMNSLLDQPVPEDEPGVVSFDHYWSVIEEDISLRSNAEVARVIDTSATLQGLLNSNYTRKHLLPLALRIIRGLSVHRLTTDDITVKVGLTPEALRDSLLLYLPMLDSSAENLLQQVQVALREIMVTVQGQFISHVPENGQYYIDVHKTTDFGLQVETRGSALSPDARNRAFFGALQQVLGLSDSTYVPNFRIWAYELPWPAHQVTRPGYLFLGLPNERSTAQPPRDFYVYIAPPFEPEAWNDEERDDEVVLSLAGYGEELDRVVRLYGGAVEMSLSAPDQRSAYLDLARRHLGELTNWLRGNLLSHLVVQFQGVTRPAVKVLAESGNTGVEGVREVLDAVAAHCLAPTFEERYPNYPRFTRATARITEAARENTALTALRTIGGLRSSALAEAVLDGLGLRNGEGTLRPYGSPYAQHLLGLLTAKGEGQVVNRSEVIQTVAGGIDRPVEKDIRFGLEPEWIAVVMAALIHSGDIEVNYGTRRVDATDIQRLASMSMNELIAFRNYGAPPSVPVGRWEEIFEVLGLPPGDIRAERQRAQVPTALQATVRAELERAVRLENRVTEGLRLWNAPLFTELATVQTQDGMVVGSQHAPDPWPVLEVLPHLRAYKALLSALQSYDSEGKLRNLRIAPEMVADARAGRAVATRTEALLGVLGALQERAAYLAQAEAHLPDSDPLVTDLHATRDELIAALRRMGRGTDPAVPGGWPARLSASRQRYVQFYVAAHRAKVLGPAGDDRRENIYRSEALKQVLELNRLHLLPSADLDSWQARITGLKQCREFHEGLLDDGPVCPSCRFDPRTAASMPDADTALDGLEAELGRLLAGWQAAVVSALNTESAQGSLAAMTPAEQATVRAFLAHPDAPTLPQGFTAAANKALKGIESVSVSLAALEAALRAGGLPCTVTEFKARLNGYLLKVLEGHQEENTRLTLWSENRGSEA